MRNLIEQLAAPGPQEPRVNGQIAGVQNLREEAAVLIAAAEAEVPVGARNALEGEVEQPQAVVGRGRYARGAGRGARRGVRGVRVGGRVARGRGARGAGHGARRGRGGRGNNDGGRPRLAALFQAFVAAERNNAMNPAEGEAGDPQAVVGRGRGAMADGGGQGNRGNNNNNRGRRGQRGRRGAREEAQVNDIAPAEARIAPIQPNEMPNLEPLPNAPAVPDNINERRLRGRIIRFNGKQLFILLRNKF